MKKIIIENLTNFIIKHKKCSKKDIKIYKYGIEALYNLFFKTIVILIICIIIGTVKECLFIILFYAFLRLFAYGIHADTSLGCWLTTIPIYVGGSIIIKYLTFSKLSVFIIYGVYAMFVLMWAPADTKKRPIIRAERRKKLKFESFIVCLIYGLLIFTNNKIVLNSIGFCMALEAVCICPLTYYITGHSFNNYIKYNQEHGLN